MSDSGSHSGNHILTDVDGGIYRITMNRAEKKHALTHAMYTRLHQAVAEAEADPKVRVIYISGDAGIFTSGNDMKDFLENPPVGQEAPVFILLQALLNASKPIVAAVSGPAVGIGTTMLLHCDLVYCDESARFRLPFVNLGLCPEAGSSLLLPLLAGYQRAAEILLLGEVFDASTAGQIGLVSRIVPAAELQDYALARARQIAAQPPSAIRLCKNLMQQGRKAAVAAHMALEGEHFVNRLHSPEAKEAMGAFMEKRQPDFSQFG